MTLLALKLNTSSCRHAFRSLNQLNVNRKIRPFSTLNEIAKNEKTVNLLLIKNNNDKVAKFFERHTQPNRLYSQPKSHHHKTNTETKHHSVPILTTDVEEAADQFSSPRITVIGVGGAGGNAVNTMIDRQLTGVSFIAANTDAQALNLSKATTKIQLGRKATHGLGAGSKPPVGKAAAEESIAEILQQIDGNHMIFITAGMGGGTGTGAAPVIAEAAREKGILTVGIVTTPFSFEGRRRMLVAEEGISELEKAVDTLIVIPNQKLLLMGGEKKISWGESFKLVDSVLYDGVKSVTDLLVVPGEINLDFADVHTIMRGMGRALIGTGEAEGRGRSKMAAAAALHNPLLDDISIKGAKGVLINVYGGEDLQLTEVDEIASVIHESVDPEANIIFGSTFDAKLNGRVRVSLIVTGMDKSLRKAQRLMTSAVRPGEEEIGTTHKEDEEASKEPSNAQNLQDQQNQSEQPAQNTNQSGLESAKSWLKGVLKHW